MGGTPRGVRPHAHLSVHGSGKHTQLWERFPLAMQSALKRHDALLRVAVESANGRVVLTTGDAILAVFDSVQDGVRAGLEAQGDLLDEPWGETGTLSVRGCTLERRSRAAGFEQVELLDARFLAIGFVWARKPAVVG